MAGAVVTEQAATEPPVFRPVRRRQVFYIPGFDPFPARRYRELYRTEAARQAALSGHRIAVSAGNEGAQVWQVSAVIEGAEVQTRFQVLGWADLVQGAMGQGIIATYGQMLRVVALYAGSGALFRLMRLRKGPILAALYPVAGLLVQLALALALAALIGGAVTAALKGAALHGFAGAGGAAAAVIVVLAVLRLFRRADARFKIWYLMHDYAFAASARGAMPAPLRPRLAAFQAAIVAGLASDADEVLVIGHSSGAHLAVGALAGVLRGGVLHKGGPSTESPALSLLTLGQVVPMVSFLPAARDLRADLALVATSTAVDWVDVSAPGDGCSFALCDPVAVTGLATAAQRGPLVLSAAFSQTLAPATLRALKRRYFRLHFQYLCAFDAVTGRVGDYDYFATTAGPLTLAARYAGRNPSPARIVEPLSRWRDAMPESGSGAAGHDKVTAT